MSGFILIVEGVLPVETTPCDLAEPTSDAFELHAFLAAVVQIEDRSETCRVHRRGVRGRGSKA